MSNPFGDSDDGLGIWKIAAGVCIGSLAASAITWVAVEMRLRWELDQVATSLRSQTVQTQQQVNRSQREAAAATARVANEQAEAEERRRRDLARQQLEESDRVRARQEEASRRDSAWKGFYKPSAGCQESTATVECANEHIRAKREFESKYANGQL